MKRDANSRHSKLQGFNVQVFDDSSDEDVPAPAKKALHHHTIFNVTTTGKLSQKTTSTVAPSSPVKKKIAPQWIHDNFRASNNILDPLQEYEFLQPEFFSAWDEEHGSIDKERVRAASVRLQISFAFIT
ncbi:hypothetical protein Hypma_012250 [Hypsizygus marmoreus]|uniref:Uncharacterized protein n=1 Tax=Hypsizygus marmoreus TaxID=39966 RepID=A0A369JJN9_HYPMA|nr:hypothetical protein Hypma_012250 [Hypsizygus marmoreus]